MRDSGSHPSYLYITDLELQCNLIVNEGQLEHINYASQFSQISTLLFISGSCRFYNENILKLILVDLLNLHVLYIILVCTESVYILLPHFWIFLHDKYMLYQLWKVGMQRLSYKSIKKVYFFLSCKFDNWPKVHKYN